ncbi:MAG TPA: hypothetical protein VMI06_17240 [Terriglobia bacterium]|nr:hypothetical protein [Terriglobia bacterium]
MYYQTLFNGALTGLNSSNLMPGIIEVSSVVLLLSLLYSVYTAYAAGGDVRMMGTAAIKYLVLGLVLVNYAAAFQDVNNMFNGVANHIVGTGPGIVDVFKAWGSQIATYWQSNVTGVSGFLSAIWDLGQNAAAGILGSVLIFLAFLLYRIAYLLFCLFYTVYGAVLYVCGPLVLALMPATGVGQISRTYLINLMIFNAWGLIYAILSELIYALNLNNVNTVVNNASYLNLTIANPIVILGIASLLYALMIALIPYIASRIVRGDVGSTLLTVAGTALTAATLAASAAGTSLMGSGGGWSYAGQSGGGAGGGGNGGGPGGGVEASAGRSVDASQNSSSTPPPRPPSGGSSGLPKPWQPGYNMPGRRPNFSFTHAASWYGGYAARAAYNRLKGNQANDEA